MSRLVLGPFNRVEGDLEVSLEIEAGRVRAAQVTAPLYRGFAGLSGSERIPDRVGILRFPHRSKSTSSACRYWPPSTARWPPKGCRSKTARPSTPR